MWPCFYNLTFYYLEPLLSSLLSTLCRVYTIIYHYVPWNKPWFYGIQSCSSSIFTIHATCNVISPVKYILYLYISTSHSMCAEPNMFVFLHFLNFVLSSFVAQVQSEWFWNGSNCPYYYGYHLRFHITRELYFYCKALYIILLLLLLH